MFHKIMYKAGTHFWNNWISSHYEFLLKSQFWSREQLLDYQSKKLRKLVALSYARCSYYKNLFDENNLRPSNIETIADLQLIPTTSKSALLTNKQAIQTKVAGERMYYSETSGSTGEPLVFYRNKDWVAWHNASVFRGYRWHGVNPWDRNGYLWGYNLSASQTLKTKILDAMQNRFRLFSYSDKELEAFCHKLKKAKYLSGYSSMIYEVAKFINEDDGLRNNINIAFIKGTSEKIFENYQPVAMSAFRKNIVSEYGSAEAGIIAFECPEGNMHVNMETVAVEEFEKRIIVTNLVSNSFPIIRYELGDYIKLDEQSVCACGRESYIIKEVLGRVGKNIYGISRKYPSLTLYYIFKNLAIDHGVVLNYQAVQETKGFIEIRIEQPLSDRERQLIVAEIDKYFKEDVNYQISDNVRLISREGKLKDFVSKIE